MSKAEITTVVSRPEVPEPGPLTRFGFWARVLARKFFAHVRVDPDVADHVRNLAGRGSLVYVMRYRSFVDFMLVVSILLREGLPVPHFVADLQTAWLRPVREWMVIARYRWRHRGAASHADRAVVERQRCGRLVRQGKPVLIFMRSRSRSVVKDGLERVWTGPTPAGVDYLREVMQAGASSGQNVFLVPIAVLRGRGFRRKDARLPALFYSVQEFPGEVKRLLSLLWNARETGISVGKQIDVQEWTARYAREGSDRLLRRVARALQIFLYREERVVWGPALLPRETVRRIVLQDRHLAAIVHRRAGEAHEPESRLWRQAERYVDEIAANFSGGYFALIELLFDLIWPRIFQGFEYRGLEKVVECVKQGPVVLVPCHRSHFDYLVLSYLFHHNYLSPPHIFAGINMSFWPMGPLFRGAGAYFVRRSFEDNDLYRAVFRSYINFLVRQGYTQEFFIEGGRSRTGKILTPKLGMLGTIVDAFVGGARHDVYLVPVSIQYERVVEEEAYQRELVGAAKEKESFLGLLQARNVLRKKRGAVHISFADPISLRDAMGDRLERFQRDGNDPAIVEEQRRFTRKLGFRLLRDVNAVAVVGPTPLAASVLLNSTHTAWRYPDFLETAQTLLRFLRHVDAPMTAGLDRDAATFQDTLKFLEYSGLVHWLPFDGGIVQVPVEKRLSLDFYKNNTVHFFLFAALVASALREGLRGQELRDDVGWWLDLYRWEFALPDRPTVGAELDRVLAYFHSEGAVAAADGTGVNPDHSLVRATAGLLDNFCETYWVTTLTVAQIRPLASIPYRQLVADTGKRFAAYVALGDAGRPEGNSTVTIGNALSRLAEIGGIVTVRAAKGRDRLVQRGPSFTDLAVLERRLAAHLGRASRFPC